MTMAPTPTLKRPAKPALAVKVASPAVPSGGGGVIPDPPGGPPLFRIRVQQYDAWIELGFLPTDPMIELVDGLLVLKDRSHSGEDPMSVGIDHRYTVEKVRDQKPKVEPSGSTLQSQQPVIIPGFDEPEPDAAILNGTSDTYRRRKPTATDVTCVVEVADSSLQIDRTTKLAIYAAAGIPQYVILNLVDGQVEDHRDPGPAGYARRAVLQRGETIRFVLADGSTLDVQVDELLP